MQELWNFYAICTTVENCTQMEHEIKSSVNNCQHTSREKNYRNFLQWTSNSFSLQEVKKWSNKRESSTMINAVSKAAYLKATTQVVNGGIKPLVAAGLTHKETVVAHPSTPLSQAMPKGGIAAIAGPTGNCFLPESSDSQPIALCDKLKIFDYIIIRWGYVLTVSTFVFQSNMSIDYNHRVAM